MQLSVGSPLMLCYYPPLHAGPGVHCQVADGCLQIYSPACLCDSQGTEEVESHALLPHHPLSCPQVSTVLLAVTPSQPPLYFPAPAQQCDADTRSFQAQRLQAVLCAGTLGVWGRGPGRSELVGCSLSPTPAHQGTVSSYLLLTSFYSLC